MPAPYPLSCRKHLPAWQQRARPRRGRQRPTSLCCLCRSHACSLPYRHPRSKQLATARADAPCRAMRSRPHRSVSTPGLATRTYPAGAISQAL